MSSASSREVTGRAVEAGFDRDEPLPELAGAVLERRRRDRVGDQLPGAERSAQRAGDGLDRGRGVAQEARVAVGVGRREPGEGGVELTKERRQLGRRTFEGAPHHGDNSAHRGAIVGGAQGVPDRGVRQITVDRV